jgi:dihydrofolate reductase
MAELIVTEFVTLDGVMEAPGGEPGHPHSGWVFDHVAPGWEAYKLQEVRDASGLLLGRVTYEGFAAAWPGRDGEFADLMNGLPKWVASTTLTAPAWENTVVLAADALEQVAVLRRERTGRILVAGSRTLVHGLMGAGLVDEVRLMVFPVAVGGGARVFPDDAAKRTFAHAGTTLFDRGVALHVYRADPAAG